MTLEKITVKFDKNHWHRSQLVPKDQTYRTFPMGVMALYPTLTLITTRVKVARGQMTARFDRKETLNPKMAIKT